MENDPQFQAVLNTLDSLKTKLHINGNKQERSRISNHFSQFDFKKHMQPEHVHEALEVCPDSPLEAAQHALALCYQDALPENSRVSGIEIRTNTKLSFN
ncbi:MAG: hypothetical protein L3J82_09860 [Planctomycetes bacterium]|nr:hypothetical protein [Planctomycetota bacterium]